MLATTLSTKFIPGTNLKTQVIGANWLFLLPSLELERVIILEKPRLASLKTISRLSREVIFCHDQTKGLNQIKALNLDNVFELPMNALSNLLPISNTDLIVLSSQTITRRFFSDQRLQGVLSNLLRPGGHIYFEYREIGRKFFETGLGQQFGKQQRYWITPVAGEMYTAVPVEDNRSSSYFLRNRFDHPSIQVRGFASLEKSLNRLIVSNKITQRYGALLSKAAPFVESGPPKYLQQIALETGFEIKNYRWFSAAGGGYSTRKLVFFLFNPDSTTPDLIVKMVRNPGINYRLENEQRALTQLQESGINAARHLPKILFGGHHRSLAIVGESFVEGKPFKMVSSGLADCTYAKSAVTFLTELAINTADTNEAAPQDVGEAFRNLFEQVTRIYHLSPEQTAFLDNQISIISRIKAPFPLVFQHGDPGIWNAIVNPDHETVFLDWEAAEQKGIPLWDMFYFLRSYTTWIARRRGTRDPLKGIDSLLFRDTPIAHAWIDITRNYCEQINLSQDLVEPLFYTCWMHRALKEATRLSPTKIDRGSYISLLKYFIDRQSSQFLTSLFTLSKPHQRNLLAEKGFGEAI